MKYRAKYNDHGEKVYEEQDGVVLLDKRPPEVLSHFVLPDIEAYESPVDGRVINSRTQRRDDMARHNCRPWEGREQEVKEAHRRVSYQEQANDSRLTEAASRAYYQLDPSTRKVLRSR